MKEECANFKEAFNILDYLNEEEESILIDALKELITSIKNKRQKGGFVISVVSIKDDNNKIIGVNRQFTVRLLEKR